MFKKIVLIIFIIIAILGGSLMLRYYSLPVYTFDTENETLIKDGVVYKRSYALFQKYIDEKIKPSRKPVGRLKGDNPLWVKTFIYELDSINEEEGFMITYPIMNIEFYERVIE